jgi:hypothetical protein
MHLDAKKRSYRARRQREQTQPECGGNHDLVPEAYQCQECQWWVVPRAPAWSLEGGRNVSSASHVSRSGLS